MKKNAFLEHNDIYLRAFLQEDVLKWASWFNDPSITEYMNKGSFPITPTDQIKRLETLYQGNDNIQLAIVQKNKDVLIGTIGVHKIDWINRHADISIVLGESASRGKGYGKQAIAIMVEHAFTKLNLHKLTSGMWANNQASEAIFKSNGFIKEGHRKEQFFYRGEYVDELDYGLLRCQWKKNQENRRSELCQ
jgi:RimJ/RimL family protein N-acetyltransferase